MKQTVREHITIFFYRHVHFNTSDNFLRVTFPGMRTYWKIISQCVPAEAICQTANIFELLFVRTDISIVEANNITKFCLLRE